MAHERLAGEARPQLRAALDGWRAARGRRATRRTLTFADCNAAFGSITRIALLAEKMNRHP